MTTVVANRENTEMLPTPEFYLLQTGSIIEKYTSFSRSLEFLGEYWKAAAISRSGLSQDSRFGTISLNVTTPVIPSIARYASSAPIDPIQITVYQAVLDDLTQYIVLFRGGIVGVQMKNKAISAICHSRNILLTRKIPNVVYQSFCNHTLFRGGCKLHPEDWVTHSKVVSDSGLIVVTESIAGIQNNFFQLGEIVYGDSRRLITNQTGTTFTIHVPFATRIPSGADITIYPGCDGNPDTCIDKFDNWKNFLGMPLIPSTNPVLWGI
jgi:uncharacterized phage protein (TIGR02218 family)